MKQTSLYLPLSYIEGLDLLVKQKLYPNRAVAIRESIRDLLKLHGIWKIRKNQHPNSEE